MTILQDLMAAEGPTLDGPALVGTQDEAAMPTQNLIAKMAEAEALLRELKDWLRYIETTQPDLFSQMSGGSGGGGGGGGFGGSGGGGGGGGVVSRGGSLGGVV